MEQVTASSDGLEALIFTADGDMRQAVNSLQSTANGFGIVNQESVFKVCDQPHPKTAIQIVKSCLTGDIKNAHSKLEDLWQRGYSAQDIVQTIFKVTRNMDMPEKSKLDFLKEIGIYHMRVLEGVDSLVQVSGLLGKLCLLKESSAITA
uniref:Replication factor C C-terminal domain-containing protein n=1 Tax=Hanusia phi TaxID=3032 RepID=A0A7S0EJS6_9CRYP|mmetsp:Transcript_24938/g.56279  ORF Transcript_24938/g.56279 Transcript_24938/m.56279 type:complete len:149 (+) Transcript_24938:1-447(+)